MQTNLAETLKKVSADAAVSVQEAENSVQTTINVSEQTSTSQEAAVVTSETINSDITSAKESLQIDSQPIESVQTTKVTQSASKQTSAQTNTSTKNVTEQVTSANNENNTPNKLYYSELVRNTEAPVLDGYDGSSASLSLKSFDIEAFSDSVLNESLAVVEGEILDMWVNHYDYATASDKFEPNGRLYHKPSTVAYKIRVDKVYSGDFSVGDVVKVRVIKVDQEKHKVSLSMKGL